MHIVYFESYASRLWFRESCGLYSSPRLDTSVTSVVSTSSVMHNDYGSKSYGLKSSASVATCVHCNLFREQAEIPQRLMMP